MTAFHPSRWLRLGRALLHCGRRLIVPLRPEGISRGKPGEKIPVLSGNRTVQTATRPKVQIPPPASLAGLLANCQQ